MKKFEYRFIFNADTKYLDLAGEEGWELVTVLVFKGYDNKDVEKYILKKQIIDKTI